MGKCFEMKNAVNAISAEFAGRQLSLNLILELP